jgi:hypothetical protein
MNRPLPLALAVALALPLASVAGEIARPVLPAGAGPQRLEPDAPLLSASARGDLSDLRLRDAAGREVPYLLVPATQPEGEWVPSRLLPVRATKKESGFEADLGAVRTVSKLRLEGLPEPFLKRFRLEGSGDRVRWTVLVAEGTLFALPEERLRLTEPAFERGAYRYLRVTWDDRSSARLPTPRAVAAWAPASGPLDPPPLVVPLALARRESEPGLSRWALRLPGPHLPVAAVVLEVGGGHLLRTAVLSEARLGDGRLEPVRLGSGELRRVVRDGVTAASLRLPIAQPEELELELTVDDGDNGPLDLRAAHAELRPVPWIYFESPDGAPIEARVGVADRAAPRYDLEAVRSKLGGLRTGAARLSSPDTAKPELSPAPTAAAELAPGGPVDASAYRFRRAIAAAPAGLCALRLDAAVLARSPGLGDLRIADPSGRQVPYLLERREEPLTLALAAPVRADAPKLARKGATIYAIELPEDSLPEARLVLSTSARVFDRAVELYADDGKKRAPPRPLASGRWTHAAPERPAPSLTLRLGPVDSRRLLLVVDDGDNAPLALGGAKLLLPSWRLRFFHPGVALQLLHGARDVSAPRYDLSLLAPRLRAAPAREIDFIAAATADAGPLDAGERKGRIAFWVVLGVAVVALLALLARLLGKEVGEPPAGPP